MVAESKFSGEPQCPSCESNSPCKADSPVCASADCPKLKSSLAGSGEGDKNPPWKPKWTPIAGGIHCVNCFTFQSAGGSKCVHCGKNPHIFSEDTISKEDYRALRRLTYCRRKGKSKKL